MILLNKKLLFWQLGGFLFTALMGTLLHFAYEWSGESLLLAPFSGVNESTWEHMKLLFYPLFLFAAFESRYLEEAFSAFWCVKAIGTLLGLLLIPTLFYTYNGAVGPSPDWLNIAIFYVTAAAVFSFETFLLKKDALTCITPWAGLLFFCLTALLFTVFTWFPPHIPLFQDPLG